MSELESTLAIFEAVVRVKGSKEGKSRFITIPYAIADRMGMQGGENLRIQIVAMWREKK